MIPTFEKAPSSNVGIMSVAGDDSDIIGSWDLVYHCGDVDYTYPTDLKSRQLQSWIEDTINTVFFWFSGGSGYLLRTVNTFLGKVDYEGIGGVYSRTYYVRKIVHKEHKDLNVPVLYQYAWKTAFYSSNSFLPDDVVYVQTIHDGGPRLANN